MSTVYSSNILNGALFIKQSDGTYIQRDFKPTVFALSHNDETGAISFQSVKESGSYLDDYEDGYYVADTLNGECMFTVNYSSNIIGGTRRLGANNVGTIVSAGGASYSPNLPYFGAYLSPTTNRFYLIGRCSYSGGGSSTTRYSTGIVEVTDFTTKWLYAKMFGYASFDQGETTILITPYLQLMNDGEGKQYRALYVDNGVPTDVSVNWGLAMNTIDAPVTSLNGVTVTDSGYVEVIKATVPQILLVAKYGGISKSTTIYLNSKNTIYGYGGNSGQGGGNGSFTGPGGSWGNGIGSAPSYNLKPDLPNGSSESDSSSSGLFTRYAMSSSDLFVLGAALYADGLLTKLGKEIMSFLWNSPNEALISLISYPFDVSKLALTQNSSIKFGSLELENVTGKRLLRSSVSIDWGEIELNEFWGNFLDYAPHTKIDLYLPWCTGMVSIDPHDCLPGKLNVITNIELAKGTCIHNIFGNKGALIGTYSGTCGSQLPMTAIDSSGKALAFVTAAASAVVAGAAAGGARSAGISAANDWRTTARAYAMETARGLDPMTARNTVAREAIAQAEAPYNTIRTRATRAAVASSIAAFRIPPSVTRSGSFTANGAGLSIQYPYVMLSRPEQNVPDKYGRHYGYPSNVYITLGALDGYTEVSSIHLDGIKTATISELEELDNLLKGGVIL